MTSTLLRRRRARIWLPGDEHARLDLSNDLARRFKAAYLPGVGTHNVVPGRERFGLLPPGSLSVREVPSGAPYRTLRHTQASTIVSAVDTFSVFAYPWTAVWAGRYDTSAGSGQLLALANSGGTPYGGATWSIGGGSTVNLNFAVRHGYDTQMNMSTAVATGNALKADIVVVAQTLAPNYHQLCVNGQAVAVSTTDTVQVAGGLYSRLIFGGSANAIDHAFGAFSQGIAWSEEEMRWITAPGNLANLFERQRAFINVPFSTGGGTSISAGFGDATADGRSAGVALHTNIDAGAAPGTAQGAAAGLALHTVVAAGTGAAAAAGQSAGVAEHLVVAAGVGSASAAGHSATVNVSAGTSVNAAVGAGAAAGQQADLALHTTAGAAIGAAAAQGHTASVALHTVVSAGVAAAAAAGPSAAVALHTAVAAGVGAAAAAGQSAQVNVTGTITVNAAVGAGQAAGQPATLAEHTVLSAGVGTAPAQGLPADVAPHTAIAAGAGHAGAAGQPADLVLRRVVDAAVGAAVASGHGATINVAGIEHLVPSRTRGVDYVFTPTGVDYVAGVRGVDCYPV